MEYRLQRYVAGNSYENVNYNSGSMSYEFQTRLYERVVKYSRITPTGEYLNGGEIPKIN